MPADKQRVQHYLKAFDFKSLFVDVDRVTKRFYDRFKSEHAAFLQFIEGMASTTDREWYASLMLNRLMFIYFIQKKGFLDDDEDYLSNRLRAMQATEGKTAFFSFYRSFLRCLFRYGPGNSERSSALVEELGDVPYLNGGLFEEHPLEREYQDIQIPDEAFEGIFAFFKKWQWHLDDRPTRNDNEVNPDMLGHIFEKFTNQSRKEMGAYYTKEDITHYISSSAIIPFVFDSVEQRYPEVFKPGSTIWRQLQDSPDRYIYEAIRKGYRLPLPSDIEAGVSDLSRRNNWDEPAEATFALPSETWREVVTRRKHYEDVRHTLESGKIHTINQVMTCNLDIRRFALDAIEQCENLETALAFYRSLEQVRVLDPTCGSGSFLLAALNLLEPLYTACIKRMETLLYENDFQNEHSEILPSFSQKPDTMKECRRILHSNGQHISQELFILKSIIANNIHGVDISPEVVEICKLRLFLKLISRIRHKKELEPLPDVDFHIRAGNALPGLVSSDEAQLPFDWFIDFYQIMQNGGFNVIIGNPPYVEFRRVSKAYKLTDYTTLSTGNLYAITMERCASLLAPGGRFGMIVPSSATCTDGYIPLQKILLEQSALYISSYSDQRGKLFDIPHPRLCIILFQKGTHSRRIFSTTYLKPGRELREYLFECLKYTEVTHLVKPGIIPRYGSGIEQSIHAKLHHQSHCLGDFVCRTGKHVVYYTRKLSWFVQVTPFIPQLFDEQACLRNPSELKTLSFLTPAHADIAFVALNSHLFYWFLTTGSDCRNLNMREVQGFPLDMDRIPAPLQQALQKLAVELAQDLQRHSELKPMHYQELGHLTIQCMFPGKSISILDEIDRVLAQHHGFTHEDLDFILHFDRKYRVG